jgi:signal transduction histidine kinase
MPENNSLSYADISLLYVEDEAATREQVSRVLAARGYRLTVAENGEQALEFFSEQTPDMVLTDIMMPKLNGLEMAREMRARAPEIQIACMTAFSETSYLIEAIDIGISQFILKPFEFSNLFAALDRCQGMIELRILQKRLESENLRTKKNEAIAILAGGLAHDFNNLLQVILGYVSLARISAEPGSTVESMLTIAEQSSGSAKELGTRLLTFARGEKMAMKPTPAGQLIREVLHTGLNPTSMVTLFIDLPDDLPLVMLDADRIQQVIANLVANACEAMPQGGSLYVSASTATLAAENPLKLTPDQYLHVIFKDTGAGIPGGNLSKIFDPYFSTKEMGRQKGMGLGLALCHSIIKSHQGHILAESVPGEGTRIHIYLPVYHPN